MERTRAGLVAAKKLGRVGGRKRRMTESKIRSGKTLLISGVSPKEVRAIWELLFRRFTAGCLHPNALSLAGRFFRFVKLAPFDRIGRHPS